MGLIKEPRGIDLIVAPSVLTERDKQIISMVIADYKRTGKLPAKLSETRFHRKRKSGAKL